MPFDAEYWRQKAAEARAIAELMSLEEARRRMLEIAEQYDRLAEQAELDSKKANDKS